MLVMAALLLDAVRIIAYHIIGEGDMAMVEGVAGGTCLPNSLWGSIFFIGPLFLMSITVLYSFTLFTNAPPF